MDQMRPSKENVREYLKQRQAGRTPLPTPDEIRRQLGWPLKNAPSPPWPEKEAGKTAGN